MKKKFDVGKIKATIGLNMWFITIWNNRNVRVYMVLKPWIKL